FAELGRGRPKPGNTSDRAFFGDDSLRGFNASVHVQAAASRRPASLPKQPPTHWGFSFSAARTGTCRQRYRAFPSPADAKDRDRGETDHRRGDRGSIASFAAQIRTR